MQNEVLIEKLAGLFETMEQYNAFREVESRMEEIKSLWRKGFIERLEENLKERNSPFEIQLWNNERFGITFHLKSVVVLKENLSLYFNNGVWKFYSWGNNLQQVINENNSEDNRNLLAQFLNINPQRNVKPFDQEKPSEWYRHTSEDLHIVRDVEELIWIAGHEPQTLIDQIVERLEVVSENKELLQKFKDLQSQSLLPEEN